MGRRGSWSSLVSKWVCFKGGATELKADGNGVVV